MRSVGCRESHLPSHIHYAGDTMMSTPIRLTAWLGLVCAAQLAACGGGGSSSPPAIDADAGADVSDNTGGSNGDAESANYRLEIQSTWTQANFPTQYPANDHLSGLIGAVHNAQVIFWEPGQLASDGVENMAETGGKEPLRSEISLAINQGSALAILDGPGIPDGSGSAAVTAQLTPDYSRITLTSMLAPSPDWFIGVSGLDLRPNGRWLDELVVPLPAWDAGTDSGASYTSANADTNPPDIIGLLTTTPQDADFENGVKRGTPSIHAGQLIITRIESGR